MSHQVFVAVDAGNTKTDALAMRADGTAVAWGQSGCGDVYGDAGECAAVARVLAALEAALGPATADGLGDVDVAHIAFRLAGVDWPEDDEFWRRVIRAQWGYRGTFSLLNDGFAGIRLGHLSGIALAITAGTGGAIAARNTGSREFGLNMWGPHQLGAKGLGIAGYERVALAELGMAPPTVLSERYARFFGVTDAAGVVNFFTSRRRHPFRPLLATAAPLVTAAAVEGDAVAREIVRDQAELLVSYAIAVAGRVGFSPARPLPVVLGGQVLRAPGSPVTALLRRRLREEFPLADIRLAELPAVCGAGLDALAEGGTKLSPEVAGRLATSLPSVPRLVAAG